jgi:2-oxoglutarate dehydrogenase E2 component (dihydrolipoamide succinyltransferase)
MSIPITVPQLGESVVEAQVAKWLKKEGDRVEVGEPVVSLETDKIDLEVGAERGGVLASIKRQTGEDVHVGDVLGVIDEQPGPGAGNGAQSSAAPPAGANATPAAPPAGAPHAGPSRAASGQTAASAAAVDQTAASSTASRQPAATPAEKLPEEPAAGPAVAAPAPSELASDASRPRATPTARNVARAHTIDLSRLEGSGIGGRITKSDVEAEVQQSSTDRAEDSPATAETRGAQRTPPAAPRRGEPGDTQAPAVGTRTDHDRAVPVPAPAVVPAAPARAEERLRMSRRRITIARNLVEAQHAAAMLTTFNEVDMSEVMALRARQKEPFRKRSGVGLGITSFFVKAAVAALRAFPQLNAEIDGDDIILKHYHDIGIAVGDPRGLVVPVIRDAGERSFAQIESAIHEFAQKASAGSLTLDDLRGGTFTITNGGVFGSLLSTPILNPPQVGILGLHKIEERPVAVKGEVVVRPMMYVALTYDHRIVDGLEAVQFLVRIKQLVEDPGELLLES